MEYGLSQSGSLLGKNRLAVPIPRPGNTLYFEGVRLDI
jgi:hypothetical protein